MSLERYLRLIAGFFVIVTVALGYWVHPAWFLVHRVCRFEPVPVGVHQLVPDDDLLAKAGRRASRMSSTALRPSSRRKKGNV